MAKLSLGHPLNCPGPLFVDTTCIDCGTCFHLGPTIFKELNDTSIVQQQPSSPEEWSQAKAAIISCPTNSIGVSAVVKEFLQVDDGLPALIQDDIYYCGYTARSSFGATSYLLKRPEGKILVDSPRFHPRLIKRIEELGGISQMYLSHQDDVADHKLFARHFDCQRIIHRLEVNQSTYDCELILEGEGEWSLDSDLKIIFTPGHTSGHLCLLYKDKYLFTGDHLFYSQASGKIYASHDVNWFSWEVQLKSLKKLLSYHFDWVMPGHGGWVERGDEQIKQDLREMIK